MAMGQVDLADDLYGSEEGAERAIPAIERGIQLDVPARPSRKAVSFEGSGVRHRGLLFTMKRVLAPCRLPYSAIKNPLVQRMLPARHIIVNRCDRRR